MALRVAMVHSFYDSVRPSGENLQVEAEADALRRAGVEVRVFATRTDDEARDPLYPLRCAARVATGRGASPRRAVDAWRPDVVHVHNLFPNLGRRWVRDLVTPVVATLHNYRFTCANGVLVRDGRPCTDCPDGHRSSAVRHRCYRGSLAATVPVALGQRRGPAADPLLARADRLLCLSARQRRMLEEAGLPPHRLVDWSNFLPRPLAPPAEPAVPAARRGTLYVGRLSPEKGVLELVRAWRGPELLTVVGDGPQAAEVRRAAAGRPVVVRGTLPRAEVVALMGTSTALLVPGTAPELAPLTFMEAMASGLPVVVRPPSDLAATVRGQGVGAVATSVGDMGDDAARVSAEPGIAWRCRALYAARFTEAAWLRRLTSLYVDLVAPSRREEPAR